MKFVAFERAKQGTGASRRLRNVGKTPVFFGPPLATLPASKRSHVASRPEASGVTSPMPVMTTRRISATGP